MQHVGPLAAGVALFVRGPRAGRKAVYAQCDGMQMLFITGEPAATWRRGGSGITDFIGMALCHAHPLLRQHQPLEQTT